MLHHLITVWFQWVQDWGYLGVIILMAMESSIFPVPSEVVMPPAAMLAAQGKLNFWLVVLAGTFGSWLGSAITYGISRWLGRPFVLKFGKWFFISPEKLARAEVFMARYEAGGIFFARLLPVVRHLISIPAGIVRMPFGKFSAMTVIGSFLWCTVLSWYGGGIAERNPDLMKDPETLLHAIKQESGLFVYIVFVICQLYFLMLRLTKDHSSIESSSSESMSHSNKVKSNFRAMGWLFPVNGICLYSLGGKHSGMSMFAVFFDVLVTGFLVVGAVWLFSLFIPVKRK